jgi:hypothetical protein
MIRAGILGVALFATIGAASAATISVAAMPGSSETLVGIDGDFVVSDFDKFRSKVSALSKALVILRSDGGNAIAGLEIGRLIRLKNFSTIVPHDRRCASACALAWLGGTPRYMGANAEIGFHAVYDARTGQEDGAGNALVGAYLNQLGLPDGAVYFITRAPPTSITWLTQTDAERVGIEIATIRPLPQSSAEEDEWAAAGFNPEPGHNWRDDPIVGGPAASTVAPAAGAAINSQFVEFPEDNSTEIYDLSTVQILLPGKFSIIATSIDKPDVMRLKLKAHDTLEVYCQRPNGEYEAPDDLFVLGPPDMPVSKIKIETTDKKDAGDRIYSTRLAIWALPYVRFASRRATGIEPEEAIVMCKGADAKSLNRMTRNDILNGTRTKEIFDCNHALWGLGELSSDHIFIMNPLQQLRSNILLYYEALCSKVTGKEPYAPP